MTEWDGLERRRSPRVGALNDLEFHWGDAYEISEGSGVWRAARMDGRGTLIATSSEELRLEIIRDYSARPVPR